MSEEPLKPSDLETRMTRMEGKMEHVGSQINSLAATLSAISSQVSNIGKPNWSTFIGFAGLLFPLIAAGYFFVTLNMQAVISPLLSRSERSETDRAHLNGAVANLTDRIHGLEAGLKSQESRFVAALVEQETQFSAMSQLGNMRAAGSQQRIQLLWQKAYGEPLPDGEYFYNMSQTRALPGATH